MNLLARATPVLNPTTGLYLLLGSLCCAADAVPRHYVFFNRERQRIYDPTFLETRAFQGAQLKYTWRELERRKGEYDFGAIGEDLAFLGAKGKKLFIQLQDVSFDPAIVNIPLYLTKDPIYHGGVDRQYEINNDDEEHATPAGWVARRWDRAVQGRFHKLLAALGQEFDGRIEGINLPETAVAFGESGRLYPKDFTPAAYRDAVVANMAALKRAFPKSVAMQYANFMPGEWLPEKDRGYLRTVYRRAAELGVGVGGPDLLPYRPAQMKHCYPLLRRVAGVVATGIAVQEGNYRQKDPQNGAQMTIAELVEFAKVDLKVDYIFWCTEEPFYSRDLLPYLNRRQ